MKIEKEVLKKLYIDDELSVMEISKIVDIKESTIYWYMKKFDIPRRISSRAGKLSWQNGYSKVTNNFKKSVTKNIAKARLGITDESRIKQSETMIKKYDNGLLPWNFREGAQNKLARRCRKPRWIKLSKKVRERDNYICQKCKKRSVLNHVHHLDGDDENNNEENLITICPSCHMKETWRLGQISKLIN